MTDRLCCDMGFKSIQKYKEILCGDHVEMLQMEDTFVAVLADGMTSGAKAGILSTLTGKMIATMIANKLPMMECLSTLAATLPVDEEKNASYATFTIVRILEARRVQFIRYGDMRVLMIRDGQAMEYEEEPFVLEDKTLYFKEMPIQEGDTMVLLSDGVCCEDFQMEELTALMEAFSQLGYSAKTLAGMLADECCFHQQDQPVDDISACVVKVNKRVSANIMFGPPSSKELDDTFMKDFFASQGAHIVCGGTTSMITSRYLNSPVINLPETGMDGVPPMAKIQGVDLVTEGVVTLNRVADYAEDFLQDNRLAGKWGMGRDGASLICRKLFEEVYDVHFFIGQAINEGHAEGRLSVDFQFKMHLVKKLEKLLTRMGKQVTVKYY